MPSEIILLKYPGICPACFDYFIISLLKLEGNDSPIRKFEFKRDEIIQRVKELADDYKEPKHCKCLNRIITHNREKDIAVSLRTDLDEIRMHYYKILQSKNVLPVKVVDFETMFNKIYANVHHVLSLELIVFHLLEEVGEGTQTLKDLYTYDDSREPFSPTLEKKERQGCLRKLPILYHGSLLPH